MGGFRQLRHGIWNGEVCGKINWDLRLGDALEDVASTLV